MSTESLSPSRRSFLKLIAIFLAVGYGVWLLLQFWPVDLKMGPQTTVISGPLRADGSINYAAALNDDCSVGVTPENNAVVLLLMALGPNIIEPVIREKYLDRLGMPLTADDVEPFRPLKKIVGGDSRQLERVYREMDRLIKAPWSAAEHPELAQWVAVNEDALQLCVQASRRERYFDPLIPPEDGALLETSMNLTQATRPLARLLAVRVTLHLGEGRVDAALEDVAALHRLSRLVAQHPLFISQLAAFSHSALAVAGDAAIIQSGQISVEQAGRQREMLAALPPFPALAAVMNHGERYAILDSIQAQALAELQPNVILGRVNAGIDELIEALQRSDMQSQHTALDVVRERLNRPSNLDWTSAGNMAFTPRRAMAAQIGDRLISSAISSVDRMINATCRECLRCEMATVGYALAQYRLAHGEHPETLQLLVPDYLRQLPTDPFCDAPLRYVRDETAGGILVYSVGENGRDEGGAFYHGGGDDISFGAAPVRDL